MSLAPVLICPPLGRVILVAPHHAVATSVRTMLSRGGYHVLLASTAEEARRAADVAGPAVIVSETPLALGGVVPVVALGDESSPDIHPVDERALLAAVARALRAAPAQAPDAFGRVIGHAPELREVCDVIGRAAATDVTVLVLGESGTGKELMAQALHELSPRRNAPFVKVSCAALSETLLESELFGHEKGAFTGAIARKEGRFELADGGTLFLDEIGDISPATQVKLLRVLQNHELERVGGTKTLKVDVRIVAATNRDLARDVREGRFREDLFFRLNVVSVTLPPLRERRTDIPLLAVHFLERLGTRYGKPARTLAPETLSALMRYDWPGNVRELENVLERAVVLGRNDEIGIDDLPPFLRGPSSTRSPVQPGLTLYEIEREAILGTLQAVGGSTAGAAQLLGISIRKVQYRLQEYAGMTSVRRPGR